MGKIVDIYLETKDFMEVVRQTGLPAFKVHMVLLQHGILTIHDKVRYGSRAQKLGGQAEALFQRLVPKAVDSNKFYKVNTPVYDFVLGQLKINVKYSSYRKDGRWGFDFRKKPDIGVLFLEREKGMELKDPYILIIPGNFIQIKEMLSISKSSLFFTDFVVKQDDLAQVLDDYATLIGEG